MSLALGVLRASPTVLVVGTFRSGTNLLKHLLETHYRVNPVFSRWFWKHGLPPTGIQKPLPQQVPVITITKHPVALNSSLYAFWGSTRPELDRGRSVSEFIRRPLIVYDNSDIGRQPRYRFSTPTDYWNQYHFAWIHWTEIAPRRVFVQVEALQADPARVLEPLADCLGLKRRTTGRMQLPSRPVAPSSDHEHTVLTSESCGPASAFASGIALGREDIDHVWNLVDADVAGKLGYHR